MTRALVIATYNSGEALSRTLEENLRNGWDEIILVDGRSTDNTAEVVSGLAAKYSARVVLHPTEKKGLANARNIGTGLANSDFIMHAGPDNVIPLATIGAMLEALGTYDLVSCQTGLGEIRTYWDRVHELYKRRFVPGERPVVGTPYIARRELFLAYPFNEAMLNSDDTELCERLRVAGKGIYRCPEVCLEYSFTTVADFRERWLRWGRGDALFYNKMKSQWGVRRRIKSLLRPLVAEMVESKARLSWGEYAYCLPFLLMVLSFRYYGWARYSVLSLLRGKRT